MLRAEEFSADCLSYDSVHLAAYAELSRRSQPQPELITFDRQLAEAATQWLRQFRRER